MLLDVARQRTPQPKWQRYQIAAACIAGLIGIALFILQGFDRLLFGLDLDFGVLPWGLVTIAAWVLFGIRLSSGTITQDEREEP